jgi:hypothetical protein
MSSQDWDKGDALWISYPDWAMPKGGQGEAGYMNMRKLQVSIFLNSTILEGK